MVYAYAWDTTPEDIRVATSNKGYYFDVAGNGDYVPADGDFLEEEGDGCLNPNLSNSWAYDFVKVLFMANTMNIVELKRFAASEILRTEAV